jgi:hypothetical protein
MKRFTDIDVFHRSSDSEWAAPTLFIQAKKTGNVRIFTDVRILFNAKIKRKPFPFPLPKTSDILRKLVKWI